MKNISHAFFKGSVLGFMVIAIVFMVSIVHKVEDIRASNKAIACYDLNETEEQMQQCIADE